MKLINKPNDYSPDNLLHYMIHGGKCKIDCFVKLKTGEIEPFSKYGLGYQTSQGGTKDGYDIEAIRCYKMNNATNKLETSAIDELYLDITLEGSKNANRFSVRPTGKEGNGGDKVWLFLHGVLDSCEQLEYTYAASTTNDSRDIKIYLADEYVDPIDEVHWDSTTNPFEYIIKQQFYEVSPNPNGATTLYTDYNITSSKIITADNITTMRSDLNLVTNNVDVISYDVNEMNTVMESLKGRVSRTEQVTQHLEDDVDNLRIVSWTALAFGVAGTAGSIGSIGMQLFPDGISFPTIKGGGFLKRLFSHKSTKGMSDLVRNSINIHSPHQL
ncbi:hypothetical protein, partial [Bacteroides acidifaciens]|uniref:hypothetical protein n=1 Tax=Bacteroides acidifaciens TaxID=85831 RepID=UPI0025A5C06B